MSLEPVNRELSFHTHVLRLDFGLTFSEAILYIIFLGSLVVS
jgi:hypothetical protein